MGFQFGCATDPNNIVINNIHLIDRENAKKLMLENDALQSQMMSTERDTIDVITYLKKQDHEKDSQLERFQVQIREMRKEHRQEKEVIVEDFSKQINDLEEKLGEKMREVELMQSELKMVKEFRRKRGLMQKELDEVERSLLLIIIAV